MGRDERDKNMTIYEIGIKNRSPRMISADKMEVDHRGALVFKNKIESSTLRSKDRYVIKLIINAQKWDYVDVK